MPGQSSREGPRVGRLLPIILALFALSVLADRSEASPDRSASFAAPAATRPSAAPARYEPLTDLSTQLQACTGCHGPEGRAGPDGYYPRLAGKPAEYLYAQLLHFREGRRSYDLMRRLLTPLSDRYLAEIAQHFAAQQLPYAPPAPGRLSREEQARARLLVDSGDPARGIKACKECHGDKLMGRAPSVPALLGLSRDYINAQLGAWREGLRRSFAPDCMAQISQQLSNTEVALLSNYLSSQPVPVSNPSNAQSDKTSDGKDDACSTLPAPVARALSREEVRPAPVSAGEYLARLGNCAGCHNTPGASALAGGKAIVTPFGAVYSSNLTPDRRTGLGLWSADDFWQAMRNGRSRDGRWLYPAFPYTHYSGISRSDSDQLFSWLRSLTPVEQPNKAHQLTWPANTQWALALWRQLFFKPLDWRADPRQPAVWNRGAYLAETLGHCGACHTPRNRMGATDTRRPLAGARMPETGWFAPALHARSDATPPDGGPSVSEVGMLLSTGISTVHRMSGPMAEIVATSLQFLTPSDRDALAMYLSGPADATTAGRTKPQQASENRRAPASTNTAADLSDSRGFLLYSKYCGDCHGESGDGKSPGSPALVSHPTLTQKDPSNLINIVLYGGFSAATAGNPRPYGMPPLLLELNDRDVAAVVTFVRRQWGNQPEPVKERDVQQQRGLKAH